MPSVTPATKPYLLSNIKLPSEMTGLHTALNEPGQRLYRQAVRNRIRTLLNDPAIEGHEKRAGCQKLEQPNVPIETLEKRRDKLIEIISERRLARQLAA
jgi:hypothetical protein